MGGGDRGGKVWSCFLVFQLVLKGGVLVLLFLPKFSINIGAEPASEGFCEAWSKRIPARLSREPRAVAGEVQAPRDAPSR